MMHVERVFPVDLARLRVQRSDGTRMPDDQLPGAATLVMNGGLYPGPRRMTARAKAPCPSSCRKATTLASGSPPTRAIRRSPVYQRRTGNPPTRQRRVVVVDVILLPDHGACLSVQTGAGHPSHPRYRRGHRRLSASLVDRWRMPSRCSRGPLTLPKQIARCLVPAQRALRTPVPLLADDVRHIDAAVRDRGPRVAVPNFRPPCRFESPGGKLSTMPVSVQTPARLYHATRANLRPTRLSNPTTASKGKAAGGG